MEDIEHIVYISTNIETGCKCCQGTGYMGGDRFAESINHYIEKHGYRLLHVGQETIFDSDCKPWQTTVAVLGI